MERTVFIAKMIGYICLGELLHAMDIGIDSVERNESAKIGGSIVLLFAALN